METKVKQNHIRLAVLPLQNLSDDTDTEIFCTGLVMDIITDLSRFRSFHITSFSASRKMPSDEIADLETELDYVVKGLARYQNNQLILNLQLVNAKQNRLVWAEKFVGPLEEIFQIEQSIIEKIVFSLQKFLDHDILTEIRKKPITSLSAYECWLRGFQELKKGTLEADDQARIYFQKAIDIDPHYARSYSGMSLSYFNEWSCQIWDRWEVSQKGAFEWALKAVELDEWDHIGMVILGKIYLFNGEYEKSEYYLRQALQLNPSDAENLVRIAIAFGYLGYLDEAFELYEKSRRLSSSTDDGVATCGAFLHFEAGNIDTAIELMEKNNAGRSWVDFAAYKAAAYFMKGDMPKMSENWNQFLEEFRNKINKGEDADSLTALKWVLSVNPYRGETQLKKFWDYLSSGNALPDLSQQTNSIPIYENTFQLAEGGLWIFNFAGKSIQMAELKGFRDISILLKNPMQPIHCSELMGTELTEKGEEVFDEKARKAYQTRILELQHELGQRELQYSEEMTDLQEEYDQLLDHLTKSIGIGGKTRKISATVEKTRSAVTWRLRNAIRKIKNVHPALGRHLEISIKTGIFCQYAPEQIVEWQL